jgi:hypothetical protein
MNNTIPKPAAASFSHISAASAHCLYVLLLFLVECNIVYLTDRGQPHIFDVIGDNP